ncbi:fibrinogen C domain-containing protein 1-like [Haematobia irritans]|uniref:fibrinogen C domain-containing protein 1-like n=1 Tax=Haematobia irritans TaxID=7368 RepID=UPI003F504429
MIDAGIIIAFWAVVNAAVATETSNNEFLDLNNANDTAFLWKNLFMKLNTVVEQTDKMNNNLMDLRQRFEDLNKRFESQDALLKKIVSLNRPWTTILRRQDGSVNFNRPWNEYSNGFGDPNGEYFMGLQRIHEITTYGPPQELRIIIKDFNGQMRYAHYDLFRIGSEAEKYALLKVENYTGDAGNDFANHRGHKFTTSDQDNDDNNQRNCGVVFSGGWWFFSTCYTCYLTGPYRPPNQAHTWGISWNSFHGWDHSLKFAVMMIRPKL